MKKLIGIGNKLIALFIIMLTVVAVFVPSFDFLEGIADYMVHFLFFLILSGLTGLAVGSRTVLYTSFGCAMVLALFLKNASNTELKDPKINNEVSIKAAHINLSLIGDVETIKKIMADTTLDIISFQEFTPDWANIIPHLASNSFPYHFTDTRIDIFGKSIYSKYPLQNSEILKFTNTPNLYCELVKENQNFRILSVYMTPALDKLSKNVAKEEFRLLKEYIINSNYDFLVLGELNQVYWSHDIISFRNGTGLLNSRRDINPSKLSMPYSHIFYSPRLECYSFQDVLDQSFNYIGCTGAFQRKINRNKYKEAY